MTLAKHVTAINVNSKVLKERFNINWSLVSDKAQNTDVGCRILASRKKTNYTVHVVG